ncbi:glycosyl hydrolase family 43 [Fulvivirga sp. M361]|uniref:glycoside hydrolase family protein n=1 Tax=Fulvivirga sp. M361 TaxID=2594266 RepID=UPI00117A0F08|nr:glycoside hydrolase family protein [Fulvivirga sp. M361]TRX52227.1 glycosyl hydrolase family 43 [Fulvivirga sp. M361]
MNKILTLPVFILISILTHHLMAQEMISQTQPIKESWVCKSLADSGKFILESQAEAYRVWGCAPIYDDEGKVHVFFSRWPHEGHWLKNSEIAHAVADHPEGPYQVTSTVLKGRGTNYWDAHSIHNPSVYRVDDKYVLLYIGNDTTKRDTWRDRASEANTQRVGMAIADTPYGPWRRSEQPVIDVSADTMAWDGYCTVNPAFVKHPDGDYWIYYRAWDRRNDDRRKTGVAMAKKLEGPYVKYDRNPVIDFPERGGQTEDPYFFYYNGKFHCLIRDMGNYDWLSGLYLESEDGLRWGEYQRGHYTGAHYFKVPEGSRYERVQVLFKEGRPEYLFNSIEHGEDKSTGAVLKFQKDK